MNYLQNHIWCSESIWDDKQYNCRHLVSLSSYEEGYIEDWNNLIDEGGDSYIDGEETAFMRRYLEKEGVPSDSISPISKRTNNLKPDVLEWLHNNVLDRKDEDCVKGWAIGSVRYRSNSCSCFTIFFHRKSGAMRFIKTFSVYKKPINYCQYFSDVRKKLNLKSMRYES